MTQSVHDVNINRVEPLVAPRELLKILPASHTITSTVYENREQIKRIISGDDHLGHERVHGIILLHCLLSILVLRR